MIEGVKAQIQEKIPDLKFNEKYDGYKDRKIIEWDQLNKILDFKITKVNQTVGTGLEITEGWY